MAGGRVESVTDGTIADRLTKLPEQIVHFASELQDIDKKGHLFAVVVVATPEGRRAGSLVVFPGVKPETRETMLAALIDTLSRMTEAINIEIQKLGYPALPDFLKEFGGDSDSEVH